MYFYRILWPGLTADVNNMAKNCETCQKHAPKQGQEQILVHEPTATKPWSKLWFPYVKQLPNITSRSSINVFKTLFADHGFCDILITYNDPHMCHRNLKLFFETAPSNISPAVQCTHNLMDLLNKWWKWWKMLSLNLLKPMRIPTEHC